MGIQASLIEGTVRKVKDGSVLVTRTNEAFGEVAKSAAKVGELVAEIAAASNEQAQGIDQVNKAVAEMDKVVQQNAANAEESASASEEMNAQAEQMKGFVGELVSLVEGVGKTVGSKQYAVGSGEGVGTRPLRPGPKTGKSGRSKALVVPTPHGSTPALGRGKKVGPVEVLPLEDEEFKNF
jgi:methyl-accepting chemotaxis protein